MTHLIRLVDDMGLDPEAERRWLRAIDVDAYGGRGLVTWTTDRSKAMRFADLGEAFECWRRQSTVVPLRDDGKPNRPLTAFTITFDVIEDEA